MVTLFKLDKWILSCYQQLFLAFQAYFQKLIKNYIFAFDGCFSNLQEFKTPDMSGFLQKRKLFDWVNFKMQHKKNSLSCAMTFSTTTLSIAAHSVTTLSITAHRIMMLTINDNQHNNAQNKYHESHYAECRIILLFRKCRYAKCHYVECRPAECLGALSAFSQIF